MTRRERADATALRALAGELGIQRAYRDATGVRRTARPEALASVARALGADPGERGERAQAALRELQAQAAATLAPPVTVAWNGIGAVELRAPASDVEWTVRLEDGAERRGRDRADATADGRARLSLPALPPGYHDVRVACDGREAVTRVVSAPGRAYAAGPAPAWGVFLPLYALPGRFGVGDFGGLADLVAWTGGHGGRLVGSTPLHAAFLDQPFEPSPYAPVSRMYWNELHVAPERTVELERSPEARRLLDAPELAALRAGRLVDHRAAMAAKRRVLEALLAALPDARRAALERHLDEHPDAGRYAGFRARCEREGAGWPGWSGDERTVDAADSPVARYHEYAQLLCSEQLTAAGSGPGGLYLDMPLGVHPDGYDTWRFPEAFAQGASAGAPPDAFFTGGQDWGFPPLNPRRLAEHRHEYLVGALQELLRHAAAVRIDHVMGLHRLYWVPHGLSAVDGVYVRYPADELYAVLTLESHRHRTTVIGEDLGTVPREVRRAMGRRGVLRSHVLQMEAFGPDPLVPAPRASLASLNTHDMPTFAGFWAGEDIDRRAALGQLDAAGVRRERRERGEVVARLSRALERAGRPAGSASAALEGCLDHLAASPARVLLANLEDLWLEPEPQNLPGTGDEHPNWRRRARHGPGELDQLPDVRRRVERIADLRREAA